MRWLLAAVVFTLLPPSAHAFTALPYVQIDFAHYFRLAQCEAKCAEKYGTSVRRRLLDGRHIEHIACIDEKAKFCEVGCSRRRTFSHKAVRSVQVALEDGSHFWEDSSAHAGRSGASPVTGVRVGCMNAASSESGEFEESVEAIVFVDADENHTAPVRYIVQWKQRAYNHGAAEESGWITASIEEERSFKMIGMMPGVQYRLMVTAIGPEGRLGSPVMSDWAEAISLALLLRPPLAPSKITPRFDSENGVSALVHWPRTSPSRSASDVSDVSPSFFDSCHYRIVTTNSTHQQANTFTVDGGEGYLLTHLEFSTEYTVSVSALPAAAFAEALNGSPPLEEKFQTLACNEIFGSGSLHCPPEPVHRLRVQLLPNGTADLEWTPSSDHSAILTYQLFYESLTDEPHCLREAVSTYLDAKKTSTRIELGSGRGCEYRIRLINYDIIGRDAVAETRVLYDSSPEEGALGVWLFAVPAAALALLVLLLKLCTFACCCARAQKVTADEKNTLAAVL